MIEPTSTRRALASVAVAVAVAVSLALAGGCSTRPNPAFCCSDPADCSRFGVTDEKRDCAEGSTCVGNTCVHACSDAEDCDSAEPVCEGNLCRKCVLDSECQSGACADDGTCAPEASVVYVHPQGQDVGPCSRAQPCLTLGFAVGQTSNERNHIVLAPGSYSEPGLISIAPGAASALWIHGGNATVTGGNDDGFCNIAVPTVLRDLELVNPRGSALGVQATSTLERVRLRALMGINANAILVVKDADIQATSFGIAIAGGSLTLDRVVIHGGVTAIESRAAPVVDISNLLAYGTSGIAVDLSNALGSVAFTTIADSGASSPDVAGLKCTQTGLHVRSTIVWTPTILDRPPIGGACTLDTTIAGPVGVVGATNVYPAFVNPSAGDYHLGGGSPARDFANTGPATDFEGDPRPRGLRFDIGADEAP